MDGRRMKARRAVRWAVWSLAVLMLSGFIAGCATSPDVGTATESAADFQQQIDGEARIAELNEQLLTAAVESSSGGVYRVGPEDQIQVDFFGVPDLSREYRVDGRGEIVMPLVGSVPVSGLTLDEVERVVAQRFGESYLRSPQVSAQITEFRSQQFTIVGAVQNPRVYSVSRQTTLIEALAMAGGMTDRAGDIIYLTDRVRDPDTGAMQTRTLIVSIDEMMRDVAEHNVALGESALINVPRGGTVFVEGAVHRPGAVNLRGETTVLKALAEAGGITREAVQSSVRVLRRDPDTGEWRHTDVDYRQIRDNPGEDISLRNGDVVVVDTSGFRAGWAGFVRNVGVFALLGWRPL